MAKIVAQHLQRKKTLQVFNFDDSIFSADKPDQRYNQFKFDESIFSTEKPVQEIPRIDRVILM